MKNTRKNGRSRLATYDSDTQKGTGLLVDGGNGFFYVVSHIPAKIGIANDREVNPKLVGKLVQYSLDEGVVDSEGHITGVVGNWVGPATDSQKDDVAPYVDPDIISTPPPPMPGGMAPGPMDLGLGDPMMDEPMGDPMMDMGDPMGDLGGPPPEDILGPPSDDLGMDMGPPPGLEEDLPPLPDNVPIASGHRRKSSKRRLKLWEVNRPLKVRV